MSEAETIKHIRDQINRIVDYLNKPSCSVGALRGEVTSLRSLVSKLSKSPSLKTSVKKILQELQEGIESTELELKKEAPEKIITEKTVKELELRILEWRSILTQVEAFISKISIARGYIMTLKQLLVKGSVSWSDIETPLSHIRSNLLILKEEFHGCEALDNLFNEFEAILPTIPRGMLQQREIDRLSALCDAWIGHLDAVLIECSPSAQPTPEVVVKPQQVITPTGKNLYIEVEGDRFGISIPSMSRLVLGRYDPGGRDPVIPGTVSDGLKIMEENGRILKVFNNVMCRWGCMEDEEDCTHREHVVIYKDPIGESVEIRLAPRAVLPVLFSYSITESQRRLRSGESIRLGPGTTLYLWISGVYADVFRKDRHVPVKLWIEEAGTRRTIQL